MPLILGEERLIPGFEANLVGLSVGRARPSSTSTSRTTTGEPTLAGKTAHFAVELKELREKILPDARRRVRPGDGQFADLDALRAEITVRLERNALDRARHGFADRIIEYAVANATVELPDILVDQEVEVMHDEFRTSLARQGIAEQAYLKAVSQTEADLHTEFRPRAEGGSRRCSSCRRSPRSRGSRSPDADVEAEIAAARIRYADDPRTLGLLRLGAWPELHPSTLRRTRTVERLVDRWLTAHPDHPALPHFEEDDEASAVDATAAAAAAIGATDPSVVLDGEPMRRRGHRRRAGAVAPDADDVEPTPSPVADRA